MKTFLSVFNLGFLLELENHTLGSVTC